MKNFSILLGIFAAQVNAALPDVDLAGCKAFAATFENTCTVDGSGNGTAVSDVNAWPSDQKTEVACTGTMRCPGASGSSTYAQGSECKWDRKLCVTCRDDNGTVKVRVQTNALPSHCINSTVNNASETLQDWEVVWQPAVKNIENYKATDLNTSAKTDEILCDIQRTTKSNMNAASAYEQLHQSGKDTISTSVGVTLSGGSIYNSLAAGNVDAVENEAMTLDTCLSHPTKNGQLHYHFWSGCSVKDKGFWHGTEAPALCKDTTNCTKDPATMTMGTGISNQASYFTKENWDKPIGIARDGHLIVGPYVDASGTRYDCTNRDVCNGAFVGDQYVYVGSNTFPYIVGCWGPGPSPEYQPGCSNSGCGDKASTTGAFQLGMTGVLAAALLLQ